MSTLISKPWRLAVLLMLLFCLNLVTLRNLHQLLQDWQPLAPLDWKVYQSAALVVSEGQSYHLYDGADTGADPQLKASPDDAALIVLIACLSQNNMACAKRIHHSVTMIFGIAI